MELKIRQDFEGNAKEIKEVQPSKSKIYPDKELHNILISRTDLQIESSSPWMWNLVQEMYSQRIIKEQQKNTFFLVLSYIHFWVCPIHRGQADQNLTDVLQTKAPSIWRPMATRLSRILTSTFTRI